MCVYTSYFFASERYFIVFSNFFIPPILLWSLTTTISMPFSNNAFPNNTNEKNSFNEEKISSSLFNSKSKNENSLGKIFSSMHN